MLYITDITPKNRILVIDDDHELAISLGELGVNKGFNVDVAHDIIVL